MRIVRSKEELNEAYDRAKSEAKAALEMTKYMLKS